MSDKEKINKAFDEEYIKYRAAFPKDYDIPALAQTEQEPQIAINAQVVGYVKPQRTEPVCPECKAEVLYECVACSSNNYPPQPAQRTWVGIDWSEIPDEQFDNYHFGDGAKWAEQHLKEKNT